MIGLSNSFMICTNRLGKLGSFTHDDLIKQCTAVTAIVIAIVIRETQVGVWKEGSPHNKGACYPANATLLLKVCTIYTVINCLTTTNTQRSLRPDRSNPRPTPLIEPLNYFHKHAHSTHPTLCMAISAIIQHFRSQITFTTFKCPPWRHIAVGTQDCFLKRQEFKISGEKRSMYFWEMKGRLEFEGIGGRYYLRGHRVSGICNLVKSRGLWMKGLCKELQ